MLPYHYGAMDTHNLISRRQRGFTLIEIAVVLVIIAVFMAMGTVMFRGVAAAQKRSVTASRLATVDAALLQFVQLNRRLPCPADGRVAGSMAGAGLEAPVGGGVCTNLQRYGVVPWASLGISEADASDGWDRRITYRVHAALAAATGALDMSWCDPAGTGGPSGGPCNTACTNSALASCTTPANYLVGKGLTVNEVKTDAAGVTTSTAVMTPPNTGAAYILISHGETGGGGYLNSGVISPTSATADSDEEKKNYADLVFQPYYVDGAINDVGGAGHFDDIVSRISVMALASKAGLGPRSH